MITVFIVVFHWELFFHFVSPVNFSSHRLTLLSLLIAQVMPDHAPSNKHVENLIDVNDNIFRACFMPVEALLSFILPPRTKLMESR